MTVRKYSSRSQKTTLTSAITSSSASISVVSAAALMGGKTLTAGQTYTVVIDPDTAIEEIVHVYKVDGNPVAGNTLAVARGIDGSVAQAHSVGAEVRHMAIGLDYQDANDHQEATTGHGATGAVVGTTNIQTLTNKTLTAPVITSLTLGDGNLVFEGATADAFETTLTVVDPTADRTVTIPDATTTLVGTDTTQTLTNKTLTSPTLVTPALGVATATSINGTVIPTSATLIKTSDNGTVTGTMIADATIYNVDINASAAIAKTKIAGTAVTLADTGTVTSTMIADSAITSAKIADGTIVAGDIADGAVTSAKILDGTIVAGDLADGAVTSAKILDGTIVNADINATAGIAYTKLSLGGTITSADLVDGTIVATDIANGTITAAKMVTDPYARANHTGTQTASTVSDFDTQVRTSTLNQMAAPTTSLSMNTQKITNVVDPTSAQDASTKAYVDAQVNALVDGAPGTLNTLNEIATAISAGGSFESTVVLKSGSTMTGALTLSGAPSSNLHAATKAYVDTVAGSATAAAASATAAAASYDSFDDRYLGAKSSAPSVDNDGNALIEGALYWNSTSNAMLAWDGAAWASISSTSDIYRYRFTASGGETSESGLDDNGLTLSYIVGKEQVYLNGVLLVRSTDYVATNGTSISSLSALAAGDVLEIITFTAFELANVLSPTLFDAKGDLLAGTGADTVGKLTLGTNGQYLQADSSTATGLKWSTVSGYSAPTLGSTSIASGATVTTIAGLTLTAPTLTGTVTASGDINLSAAGGPGSVIDEFTLILMGAI